MYPNKDVSMSSIALITDTHYGGRKGSKNFHEYFRKVYEDVFFPELEKRNIKNCIHLGDAFDSRKSVDFWCLNWAKENVYDRFKRSRCHCLSVGW